jgi:hypothetical protein
MNETQNRLDLMTRLTTSTPTSTGTPTYTGTPICTGTLTCKGNTPEEILTCLQVKTYHLVDPFQLTQRVSAIPNG